MPTNEEVHKKIKEQAQEECESPRKKQKVDKTANTVILSEEYIVLLADIVAVVAKNILDSLSQE